MLATLRAKRNNKIIRTIFKEMVVDSHGQALDEANKKIFGRSNPCAKWERPYPRTYHLEYNFTDYYLVVWNPPTKKKTPTQTQIPF